MLAKLASTCRGALFTLFCFVAKWFFRDTLQRVFSPSFTYKRVLTQTLLGLLAYLLAVLIATLKEWSYLLDPQTWLEEATSVEATFDFAMLFVFSVLEMDNFVQNEHDRASATPKAKLRLKKYKRKQTRMLLIFVTFCVFMYWGLNNEVHVFDFSQWQEWFMSIPHPSIKKMKKSRVKRGVRGT